MDWRDMKKTGTAYIKGKLTWGAELKNVFYTTACPDGTSEYAGFIRMDWCSAQAVYEKRCH